MSGKTTHAVKKTLKRRHLEPPSGASAAEISRDSGAWCVHVVHISAKGKHGCTWETKQKAKNEKKTQRILESIQDFRLLCQCANHYTNPPLQESNAYPYASKCPEFSSCSGG
uniref:Uncharacterized protein n=1 Tax=Lotharella oceanica TaxID=641309 RepID=A0A7S2U548_9EUKA|mmetsp:Transcript_9293/g.18073  ORF Transcript_9293/g.18073 Transcript_9293/m.18073 type:complete len:112 (+) Transcript_9293:531-866(+)